MRKQTRRKELQKGISTSHALSYCLRTFPRKKWNKFPVENSRLLMNLYRSLTYHSSGFNLFIHLTFVGLPLPLAISKNVSLIFPCVSACKLWRLLWEYPKNLWWESVEVTLIMILNDATMSGACRVTNGVRLGAVGWHVTRYLRRYNVMFVLGRPSSPWCLQKCLSHRLNNVCYNSAK